MIRSVKILFLNVLAFGLVFGETAENRFVLTMTNFVNMRIDIVYATPIVITWPSSHHPVLITNHNESVRWISTKEYTAVPFSVTVDYASNQTMLTVPYGYPGKLYYFCENHASMGVHEIFLDVSNEIVIEEQNTMIDQPFTYTSIPTLYDTSQCIDIVDLLAGSRLDDRSNTVLLDVAYTIPHISRNCQVRYVFLDAYQDRQNIA